MEFKKQTIPAGYEPISEAAKAQTVARNINSSIVFQVGETIEVQAYVSSKEPKLYPITQADGSIKMEPRYATRLLCASNMREKELLLPIQIFNPYPKHRLEFLSQTSFGKDIVSFDGTVYDFAMKLVGCQFTVKELQRLSCKKTFQKVTTEGEGLFTVFEYADDSKKIND